MKTRCKTCEFLNWDFITGDYTPGPWFCGLHGRTSVDPDGEQRDLDHRGGCGYIKSTEPRQYSIW